MGDLSRIPICAELPPAGHYTERRHDVFLSLRGAKIIACGAPADPNAVEGGGLVIDFIPEGDTDPRRVVFAFTELGMWVEYSGPKGSSP
jgi:hypothetical protein